MGEVRPVGSRDRRAQIEKFREFMFELERAGQHRSEERSINVFLASSPDRPAFPRRADLVRAPILGLVASRSNA